MSQTEMLMVNPFAVLLERLDRIEELLCRPENAEVKSTLKTDKSEDLERLTIKQMAKYLGVHTNTVHKYKNNGAIPYFRVGNTIYFNSSEVDAALSSERGKKRGNKI